MNLKLLFKILLICLYMLSFYACSNSKQELNHVERYFKEIHNYRLDNKINKIVVIAEGNDCGSCENSFAKTTLQYLKDDKTIFLVTATGIIINIQPFLELDDNCFFDWDLNISEFPEFESSRVIYLNNNEIDTVLIISGKELSNQLQYIKNNP